MRTNKSPVVALRLSEKNRFYLTSLGYIDGRTGKKKSESLNMSDFINRCVTIVLENTKGLAHAKADPNELRKAYIKFCTAENNKEMERLTEQNIKLNKQMYEEDYHEEEIRCTK